MAVGGNCQRNRQQWKIHSTAGGTGHCAIFLFFLFFYCLFHQVTDLCRYICIVFQHLKHMKYSVMAWYVYGNFPEKLERINQQVNRWWVLEGEVRKDERGGGQEGGAWVSIQNFNPCVPGKLAVSVIEIKECYDWIESDHAIRYSWSLKPKRKVWDRICYSKWNLPMTHTAYLGVGRFYRRLVIISVL